MLRINFFLLLASPLVMILLLALGLNGNYSQTLMTKWKSKEIRLNYFENNKDSFETIANLFEKYPEINKIKFKADICNSLESEVKAHNVIFCVDKNSNQKDTISQLNIEKEINDLSDVRHISRREVLTEQTNYIDAAISFYIVNSINAHIHFNYCLSEEECDAKEKQYKNDEGIYIKNKIDDKWSSIYNSIPNM